MAQKTVSKNRSAKPAKAPSKKPAPGPIPDSQLPAKPRKEDKFKVVVEYIAHASPKLLYQFLSSPSGLSEWFADNVNIVGDIYTFEWDGARQQAKLIGSKEEKFIRFQWLDRPATTYFEFKIEKNELTEELSLIVTDFAESDDDRSSVEGMWESQIKNLFKVLGSH